ncbi:unnamed protein product [Didymodactylos carnosus]|uniref:G-protein coupled receptors family 1 profile domain-containing protein n=1 Tax=Didymodactylos carnosus TaxID=1234261 RepID=A0A8S2RYN2_9BILA|nr:unnamed protein product [Didymodactylos carnosus]CAF4193767.1 unnamed protein product [Didymodactylos carnosus]
MKRFAFLEQQHTTNNATSPAGMRTSRPFLLMLRATRRKLKYETFRFLQQQHTTKNVRSPAGMRTSVNDQEDMADLQFIIVVSYQYICPILVILGTIGNSFNLFIFTRNSLRKSSCSIYFITESIIDLCCLYIIVPVKYLTLGFNYDPTIGSDGFCKFYSYLSCVIQLISSWLRIIICVDRYTISSANTKIRNFSQRKITKYTIPLICIVSFLLYFHTLFYFEQTSIKTGPTTSFLICYARQGWYKQFFNAYQACISSLLTPICIMLFGLLTFQNILKQRRQINTTVRTQLHRQRDRQMLNIMLMQSTVYLLLSLPYYLALISQSFSSIQTPIQTFLVRSFLLVSFFNFIIGILVNTLVAKIYRTEVLKILNQITKTLFHSTIIERRYLLEQTDRNTFTLTQLNRPNTKRKSKSQLTSMKINNN